MQSRSALWQQIVEGGNFQLQTVAVIGSTTYSQISAPKITRAAAPDALSAGNCTSAMMDISILTDDAIPKSSQIDIQMRVTDGTNTSEWLPAGTYYIQHRSTDPTSGLKTFECYDAMLKSFADYPLGAETDWPKTMQAVITEIAGEIGVTVDARSWSGFCSSCPV